MEKEHYKINAKAKILIAIYIVVIILIAALIVLNTLLLKGIEILDNINIILTFASAVLFVVISVFQVSREIIKKKNKNNTLAKNGFLPWSLTIALSFLILRLVINDNKFIYIIYTAVMAITFILIIAKKLINISFTGIKILKSSEKKDK